jgi:hypothetical protein
MPKTKTMTTTTAKKRHVPELEPEPEVMRTPAKSTTPDPPDYTAIKGLSQTKIADVAERIAELGVQAAAIKKELDDLKALGASYLLKAKVKSVMIGSLKVTQTGGQSKSLKRDLLLKNGVDIEIIEKSYAVGNAWVSLRVTDKTRGEDEGEE